MNALKHKSLLVAFRLINQFVNLPAKGRAHIVPPISAAGIHLAGFSQASIKNDPAHINFRTVCPALQTLPQSLEFFH
ncbi:hypothetical protein DPQ25_00330 [Hydrogeniiclostridium mannosilyticum]|uniref:Uncharacterized protein n=1 Tax=Hydrogeniiclostridium mannosilyticum TaxID=2764322 RepID=A0A328UGW3_9FIRM|nr:hypothetical protein DPQ25_00330 [Hydrogeniiclostridium mannosilyticum]